MCVLLLFRNFSPVQKVFTLQTHSEKYIKCITLQLPPPSSKNITNSFFLVQQVWFTLDYHWIGIRRYVSTCVTLGTSFIPSVFPSASQRECSLKTVKVYKHSLTITSKRGKVFCLGQNYLFEGSHHENGTESVGLCQHLTLFYSSPLSSEGITWVTLREDSQRPFLSPLLPHPTSKEGGNSSLPSPPKPHL